MIDPLPMSQINEGAPQIYDVKLSGLFQGVDKFDAALPERSRLSLKPVLDNSFDPNAQRQRVANQLFLARRYQKPIREVVENYEAYRGNYAKKAFGLDEIDDGGFYTQAGGQLKKEGEQRTMFAELDKALYKHVIDGGNPTEFAQSYLPTIEQNPAFDKKHLDLYYQAVHDRADIYQNFTAEHHDAIETIRNYAKAVASSTNTSINPDEAIGTREAALKALSSIPEGDLDLVLALAHQGVKAPETGFLEKTASRLERGITNTAIAALGFIRESSAGLAELSGDDMKADAFARKAERKLDQMIQGKVDPLTSQSVWARAALSTAEGIPRIIASFSPQGLAINFAAAQSEMQGMFEDKGVDSKKAAQMAVVGGAAETALQFVSAHFVAGKIPGFESWVANLGTKVAKLGAVAGIETGVLGGSAIAQSQVPNAVQFIASTMDKEMPKVSRDELWASLGESVSPEALLQLVPMVIVGTGFGSFKNKVFAKEYVNPTRLAAAGYPESTIQKVSEAATAGEIESILKSDLGERKFNTPEQKTAIDQLAAEKLEVQDVVERQEVDKVVAAQKSQKVEPVDIGQRDPTISRGDGVETPAEAKMMEEWRAMIAKETAGPKVTKAEDGTYTVTTPEGQPIAKTNTPEMAAKVVADHTGMRETSLKNATADLERAAYGLPEATPTEKRVMADSWQRSGELAAKDPEAGAKLAQQLKDNPNLGISDDQSALLLRHKVELENALNEAAELSRSGDTPEIRAQAEQQSKTLSNQLLELMDAIKARGSEWGREGRWRQALAREDYSFASQEALLRAAKGGKELTTQEREQLQSRIDELREKTEALESHIASLSQPAERSPEVVVEKVISEAKKPPTKFSRAESIRTKLHAKAKESRKFLSGKLLSPTPEDFYHMAVIAADDIYSRGLDFTKWSTKMVLEFGEKVKPHLKQVWNQANALLRQEKRTDALERISSKRKKDKTSDIGPQVQAIAKSLVEDGINDREKLVSAVHAELKKVLPKITERETMDAISGYGQFKRMSKDQASATLRDLKGQLHQLSKIEDLSNGKKPAKTGVERRVPSEEEKALIKKVDELLKERNKKPLNPNSAAESLDEAIAEVEQELAGKEQKPKASKTPESPEIAERREYLKALRSFRDQMKRVGGPDDQVKKQIKTDLQKVKDRLTKQIDVLEKQITTREKIVKEPKQIELDSEANALKAKRDALKEQFDEIFQRPEMTDEQRLDLFKKRTSERIQELQRRIDENDFTEEPKREPVPLDDEGRRLKAEVELKRQEFEAAREKAKYQQSGVVNKVKENVLNVYDTARLLMTTGEFSFILRQGKTTVLSHPILVAKAMPDVVKALFSSKEGAHAIDLKTLDHPDIARAKAAKLHILGDTDRLSHQEELLVGKLTGKIPLIRNFEQSARVFMNKIRFDLWQNMRKVGMTAAEEKQLAMFVNEATGRGGLGPFEQAAVPLGRIMFSPRFFASRLQMVAGHSLWGGTLQTRRIIAGEYAKTLIGLGLYYTALNMWLSVGDKDAEIGDDPRSSDFGKVRIGNSRLDPLAGMAQVIVFAARTATGEKTNAKGKTVPIRGDKVPYGGERFTDVATNFARSKLHPVPAAIVNLFNGTDLGGKKADLSNQALNMAAPVTYADIYQALEEQDLPVGVSLGLLALLGEGLQTYDANKKRDKPKPNK